MIEEEEEEEKNGGDLVCRYSQLTYPIGYVLFLNTSFLIYIFDRIVMRDVQYILESSSSSSPVYSSIDQNNNSGKLQMIKENTLTNGSNFPSSSNTKSNRKRGRSQTTPLNDSKKSRSMRISNPILSSSSSSSPPFNNNDEHLFRKPLITNNNLPPITVEQILGLRGDIPDVHNWSTNDLNEFFHQQGYEYASIVLNKHHINGNKLYELKREQVFRMSTLKIGNALKLWNVIEQIQQKSLS